MRWSSQSVGVAMVCLFHGDYGPTDPAFKFDPVSTVGAHGWIVGASPFKEARNVGEAEAVQRHLLRGEAVSWCDQGYAWVEQDAISWFYTTALLLVVLPYLVLKIKARAKRALDASKRAINRRQGLTH
jgi:hypothetical protein